ncbi:MAG: DUF4166 domain-containing protein [Rhodanobacter sp.]
MNDSLFSHLLGNDAWQQLPSAVQAMHGAAARLETRGVADVTGAQHLPARWLRQLRGLPQPGANQPLTVTFERQGKREVWTRRFNHRCMRSTLSCRGDWPLLYEQLGPARLGFALRRDGNAIDWQLRSVHLLGVPLPLALQGEVLSRSGFRDGRYHFQVDVRLPWLGQLVAYDGWLEAISGD